MANTTFRLTASKADTPISGDNPSANPASTPGDSSPKAGNTGFLTQEGAKDVLGVVSSPIVSGAFIFASFILLLALIAKIKKNKQANFKDSLNKKHYTTRILAFATFLLFAAGVGGTISRFMGVEAAESELTDITTSDTVEASLIDTTDDYKLYCGTDQITLNGSSEGGYYLFMYADDDGILPTTTSGITNIASAEDWNGLGTGEWGYYVGDYSADATINPMPLGYSIIDNASTATTAGIIPVTYCAKISKNIEEAEFSTNINYEVLARDVDELYPGTDFNSLADDDADGLSNREENRYGMNPLSADSDMDSLSDYDELKVHHTDPLVEDTDEDGLADYSEVALSKAGQYNFNPLVADYNGETLEYSEPNGETTGIPFTVTGTGNVPLTYIEVSDPVDIDESFEDLSGKVYSFSSAGEVEDATITIDAVVETESTEEDDDTLGLPVSGSFTADDVLGYSLTFNEENADDNNDIPADVIDITPSVNGDKISVPITSNNSTVVVLNNESNDTDDDTLGASSLKNLISGIKTKVSAKTKSTNTTKTSKVQQIIQKAKTFVSNIATKVREGLRIKKWEVKNNFDTSKDIFIGTNVNGYYDGAKYYDDGGNCFGIALLTRLLKLNKIDRLSTHRPTTYNTEITDFSLGGLSKKDLLESYTTVKKGNKLFSTGVQGRAIYVLQHTQQNSNFEAIEGIRCVGDDGTPVINCLYPTFKDEEYARNYKVKWTYKSPASFITLIKEKIKSNDPIMMGVREKNDETIQHAVNAESLIYYGDIVEKDGSTTSHYDLLVYNNNNYYIGADVYWDVECSKAACTTEAVIGATNITSAGSVLVYYRLINDDYYNGDPVEPDPPIINPPSTKPD